LPPLCFVLVRVKVHASEHPGACFQHHSKGIATALYFNATAALF
jgi:hypothetical protein